MKQSSLSLPSSNLNGGYGTIEQTLTDISTRTAVEVAPVSGSSKAIDPNSAGVD
jgi:hypothetical protein